MLPTEPMKQPTEEEVARAFALRDGFRAFHEENRTGHLVYNPHPFGALHDAWDAGYQAAIDGEIMAETNGPVEDVERDIAQREQREDCSRED